MNLVGQWVKLLRNIPVDKKHGLYAERVVQVIAYTPHDGARNSRKVWVMSDTGEKIALLDREWTLTEEPV